MVRPNFVAAQTLLSVARLGTFTAAAKHLHTTQSAISARMRELERSLGYPLFVRQGRGLQLTIQAKQLIERIEPLIDALEGAFHDAEMVADPQGSIRIGLAEIAVEWFAQLLPHLRRELPRLQFVLEIDLSAAVHGGLESGDLDLGIIVTPETGGRLRCRSLGKSSFRWVCATFLVAESGRPPRALGELMREELLWIPPKDSPFHIPAREELARLGAEMGHVCTTNKGLLDLALAGAGIVLLPDEMIKSHLEERRLICVSDALQSLHIELFLATHMNQRQKAIQRVEDLLVKIGRSRTA